MPGAWHRNCCVDRMGNCSTSAVLVAGVLVMLVVQASDQRVLTGHVPPAVARLQPAGRLPATHQLELAIGLPLHHREALTNLLRQIYTPSSPNYHHYLTPDQFTKTFGPTEQEYQATIAFAKANGLTVRGTHANRMLLDVTGAVAEVEKAFHMTMQVYAHPQEVRTFFAPDAEPSLAAGLPVLDVSGLDNYTLPHPMGLRRKPLESDPNATPRAGSGPSHSFWGKDFRNAYVPGTSLTGAGQAVGLVELDGYFTSDITRYENQAGVRNVPLQNVLIDGFNGVPTSRISGSGNEEVALDIEMAISMAPGLAKVMVYEASPNGTTATIDDLFNRMATDNQAKQLSCSWGFDIDATSQQIFQQFAAQGQSFFLAGGDAGAFNGPVDQPADDPYITIVGGTSLTTTTSGTWTSETTWNGSGGGISTIYPIPAWQQGIDMSVNQGSTSMRNLPDVAMIADNVWDIADNGQSFAVVGTSVAAPLWAAFTALVNQQAATTGQPPVGFANPALYAIGQGPDYRSCFHDITTGNNTSSSSPNRFYAASGYDLCTGFGTPNGTSLINALLAPPTEPLLIMPPLGFTSQGPVGGPFTVTSETYTLTNAGTAPLSWSLVNPSSWLNVSPTSGTLQPGGPATTVTVSLNSTDTNLLIGYEAATVVFTDLTDGAGQPVQFTLFVGNGGFETGDFTDWNFSGDPNNTFADSIDTTSLAGSSSIPGVDDSLFVHSGIYGAFLGQNTTLGSLSQTLPTVAGQSYRLSFWLDNPAIGTPNAFSALWNGTTLVSLTDVGQFAWTNMQYVVTATGASSVLEFDFRNDLNAFGLDDITVQPVPAPAFLNTTQSGGILSFTWSAVPGITYQVQYTAQLGTPSWTNLGGAVTATSGTVTATDPISASPQRFYRVILAQ